MIDTRSATLRLSQARRDAGQRSFDVFCRTYLQAYFRLPASRMHQELFPLLQEATANRGARIAIAAPRGHAKTSIVSTAYLLWCICYQREQYIVLVSNTADQANDLLSHLKRELEENELLRMDFPEVCEDGTRRARPPWRKHEIVTRNNVKVTVMGVGGGIRGRKHKSARPSLIVLDDVENETGVRNPEQRDQLREWFDKAVSNLGGPATNIIAVGTILHFDSLLARLTSGAPGWTGKVYRAVNSFAERSDLWEQYERIYTHAEEYEGASGDGPAEAFYTANQAEMLRGTQVLWPEYEGYKDLIKLRIRLGRAAFDCEKQNQPVDPDTALFRDSDFRFWDKDYADEAELLSSLGPYVQIFGACDPSLGKQGRRNDDAAIISVVKDRNGILYVLDADIRKRKPDDLLQALVEFHALRNYARFAFESNQFQEHLADELVRLSRSQGAEVPVQKITHATDKKLRIQALQPLISSGGIRFSRRHIMLLDQLRQFPNAAHDDGPDALEMAVSVARQLNMIAVFASDGPDGALILNTPEAWEKAREDPEFGFR